MDTSINSFFIVDKRLDEWRTEDYFGSYVDDKQNVLHANAV